MSNSTHTCKVSHLCTTERRLNDPEHWIDPKIPLEIKQGMQEMILTNETLKKIQRIFLENIDRGLKKSTHPNAVVKCYITYVQDLPDGTEKGKCLALDLGGSNFRVLLVEIDGEKCHMDSEIFPLASELITGSGYALFDYVAECLANYARKHRVENDNLPLGFTFSFPAVQTNLNNAKIVKWTKGFSLPDVIGEDAGDLLAKSIAKQNVKIDVCAVVNDTTGTLMSCAFKHRDCRIGMIIGTGNNACYIEKQSNVEMFDATDRGSGHVVINLECGAFGEDGALDIIRTDIDRIIDSSYPNQGKQIQEKLVAGMYLGEIARQYILKFIKGGLLLGGKGSKKFDNEQDCFTSSYISDIEKDQPGDFKNLRTILHELGLNHATDQDCVKIRFICECCSRRSAHLMSNVIVALTHKMDVPKITVGIDGSLYKFHPHFRRLMLEKIAELLNPKYHVDLTLSEDGSGIGAALIAAVAVKNKPQ